MNLNLGNSKIFCQLCYKFAFGQKKCRKCSTTYHEGNAMTTLTASGSVRLL